MESSSLANRVQCTKETADLIKRDAPEIGVQFRQRMDVKGRGFMDTYFLSAPDSFKNIRPKRDSKSAGGRKTRHSVGDLSASTDFNSNSFRSMIESSVIHEIRESDETSTTTTNTAPRTLSTMDSDVRSASTRPTSERTDSDHLLASKDNDLDAIERDGVVPTTINPIERGSTVPTTVSPGKKEERVSIEGQLDL